MIPEITISVSFDKKIKKSEMLTINSSESAVDIFRKIFNADTFDWKEEFIMLCLNMKNAVVGYYKVSSGGINSTIADPRVIYTTALNCMATSIIVCHNHPSGQCKPSQSDKALTEQLKKSGEILSIKLLDSIIITDEGYYSFLDNGEI